MQITFSQAAEERINKLRKNDQKLVLDFDDGVGPFSDESNCTLDLAFNLVLTNKNVEPEFKPNVDSNLGKVFVKPYSQSQMSDVMSVDYNPKYARYQLNSDAGVLDPALGFKTA